MSLIKSHLPRPALVVAIVALVLATAGTALAVNQFGVGALREGARQKVVGVGKLVQVTTTTTVPVTTVQEPTTTVKATCPTAPIGNLQPISGGVKLEVKDPDFAVLDSHAIANGWTATVYNDTADAHKADLVLSCARSIAVSGSTLPTS
jgi:hypothetical protein